MAAASADRGIRTRTLLRDAAVELIVEEGWGRVSTRKVAERAGVKAGSVHYHFSTLTDLLVEATLGRLASHSEALAEKRLLDAAAAGRSSASDTKLAPDGAGACTAVLMTEALRAATRVPRLRAGLTEILHRRHAAIMYGLEGDDRLPNAASTSAILGATMNSLLLYRLIDPVVREMKLEEVLLRMTKPRTQERTGSREGVGRSTAAPRTDPPSPSSR
ncbi:TetR/AcrR family transcriptional regulator [Streptomyces tubbatahanensis]|uniref:TetR/AcrR family transcriptional regulator n=1 Tax=Streptomyces tubbatahanensis TaxID=2923272 RepID=A0ABY3XZ27_9ACTN|nr:TetR/AcrR family transcriptional regulator [Streptomyces tubbatahanensis]UNS99811.1 TetR/AcrR family transcriptional regulator [Streptomyces tubbatahanensis]